MLILNQENAAEQAAAEEKNVIDYESFTPVTKKCAQYPEY
jgi:hypothetical protein